MTTTRYFANGTVEEVLTVVAVTWTDHFTKLDLSDYSDLLKTSQLVLMDASRRQIEHEWRVLDVIDVGLDGDGETYLRIDEHTYHLRSLRPPAEVIHEVY